VKHQSTPYEDAKKMLLQSHKEVLALIEGFSNEELFENSILNGQERQVLAVTVSAQQAAITTGRLKR